MERSEIYKYVDLAVLSNTASFDDVKKACDEGIENSVASICVLPAFVAETKEYVGDRLTVSTVIGFPNGYNTTEVKLFEAIDALENGAEELDVVINVNYLKEGKHEKLYNELSALRSICGSKVLKIIVEACLLTEEEKIRACELITAAKGDYIKTSTGFSKGGATLEDVKLFAKHKGRKVKIKAAGGIRSLLAAEEFIKAGCSRIGSSSLWS